MKDYSDYAFKRGVLLGRQSVLRCSATDAILRHMQSVAFSAVLPHYQKSSS